MDRQRCALCAALVTTQLLSILSGGQAPAPAGTERRPFSRAEALLCFELGLDPGRIPPAPEALPLPGESPAGTPSPASTEAPSPTGTPSPAPTEAPSPTGTPSPAPEPPVGPSILPFTDEGGLRIKNRTSFAADIPSLMARPLTQRLPREGPEILILHTHGTEAYDTADGELYEPSDLFRTTDPRFNVIRVGDTLEQALTRKGFRVVHDRGLYDYPGYNGSYGRSAAAAVDWLSRYPDIGIIIDLHRDAIGDGETMYRAVTREDRPRAQLMLVVGTGENGLEHPRWEENLCLALHMQEALEEYCPSLTRPIHLAPERYNQQLCSGALLLEVGTCGNSLSEALSAAEAFAEAVSPLLFSLRED